SGVSRQAQPRDPGDLTLQARSILRKYCAECHHSGPNRIGELSVLDRAGLERPNRPFLNLGSPTQSQILQLVEDGSMPPGQRPRPTPEERQVLREWVAAGATAFPAGFDEGYVRRTILTDIERRTPEERIRGRYFSLHNLVRDDDVSFTLESRRAALRQAVARLSKAPGAQLTPIDAAATVFRLDIAQAGWDFRPFQRREVVEQKERLTPSPVTLHDVILIEYPFGRLDPGEPTFGRLVELFLRPANQLVPILYLRGDWFSEVFLGSRAASDLARALDLPPPPLHSGPPPRLPDDANGTGRPIRPLDGIDAPDRDSGEGGFGVLFDVWNAETRATARRFIEGGQLLLYLRPTREAFVQIVWRNADGSCGVPNLGANSLLGANTETILGGASGKGYRLKQNVLGKERLILYAAEGALPAAEHLRTKLLDERVVHRFYRLPGEETKAEADPERIIRKTIEIEIVKP
ncbi:MAG: hypothetical protein N2039_11835, partial [Gemmataceae bacterium]|nr:hypothetical protein [Gemmataceae bacterium]